MKNIVVSELRFGSEVVCSTEAEAVRVLMASRANQPTLDFVILIDGFVMSSQEIALVEADGPIHHTTVWVWQGSCYTVEFRYSVTDARPIHTACGFSSREAARQYIAQYMEVSA